MNTIQIRTILPLSDQILLIAFNDLTADLRDVKLLLNKFPELRPKMEPDLFRKALLDDPKYTDTWKAEIDHAEPEPSKDDPEITLEFSDDFLQRALSLCAKLGISFDQLVRAILQFYVCSDGYEAFSAWNSLTDD